MVHSPERRWFLQHCHCFLARICISTISSNNRSYVLRTLIDLMKENGFTLLKKAGNRQCPAKTLTDADYTYDPALLSIYCVDWNRKQELVG